jgi:hypothetical protein
MVDLKERVCIQFCFLLGKTAAETVTMLQEAFKEEALSWAWLNDSNMGKPKCLEQHLCQCHFAHHKSEMD